MCLHVNWKIEGVPFFFLSKYSRSGYDVNKTLTLHKTFGRTSLISAF